jgi:hypothetical protein
MPIHAPGRMSARGSKADDRASSAILQLCNTSITHSIRPARAAASQFPTSDRRGRSGRPLRIPQFARRGNSRYGKLTGRNRAGGGERGRNVGAAQAGAEHTIRRAADLGLDQRLVHRRHNRQLCHAEFGHVGVRAAGLPQRSALAQCQRANRQAGLQKAAREACGPSSQLVPKNLCSFAMILLPVR